ncbi:glucosidase [Thermosynechococcus sp. HN-54]|uniref:MGH1-like glycoside hydrolase domain-containing protein n=1 Tax=Thermosynechococcus sp. HN-54 TaxID=2933959 RepID=UPI00202CD2F7|nr:glucosidase [Thermosynechococcus sp. HN-54]URR36514.1 glucosidase [Thermosynechococcus sp. HN-54]
MVSRANPELERLHAVHGQANPWKSWGPYLSERQWGTVREDYSADGNAWEYFSHDQARSRAYRWGEDGLGGICDAQQRLCFALALWNGNDPILKERLFGLTNNEGNHGEDVKEYYFYLDSTPTHSYMKYLYKYPQAAYPYLDLVTTNRHRSRFEAEYELLDTGVFEGDRYFDVFIEYAKAAPNDILIQISIHNRGNEAAHLHVLPTLWYRNTWSWTPGHIPAKPELKQMDATLVRARYGELGEYEFASDRPVPFLFTENETNFERLFGQPNASPYVKDAFHRYLINGEQNAVNPGKVGTKVAAHYQVTVPAQGVEIIQLRLAPAKSSPLSFGNAFSDRLNQARTEADLFFDHLIPSDCTADQRNVVRQAFAGMMWTKQYYYYPVKQWLEDKTLPPDVEERIVTRNKSWFHLESADIISMPDKWEYPWFAAWDLAFHCAPLALMDMDFAKEQLKLMVNELYLHPNGQIPAYEWNFGDVNPPVHGIATWQIYLLDKAMNKGTGDLAFLESVFHKLMLNFTWWVNRKDSLGNNVMEGGFLGLDNIGVFDRSAPLPTGGVLEQADGTAWVAMFALDMLSMALELAQHNPVYEDMACKFYEHFVYIAGAMDRVGIQKDELWDEKDGFYYDLLRLPDGRAQRLKVRSMVGLLPLCATAVFSEELLDSLPSFQERIAAFNARHPELLVNINAIDRPGVKQRRLLSPVNEVKLRRILTRLLDETEFLSDYGIRALSRHHYDHPYIFQVGREAYRVSYEPGESTTGLFGGNSNWRGPIWMPVNALLVQALRKMYGYYGNEFTVECPTGSGRWLNLWEVSAEISRRLASIFLKDESGRRPLYGATEKFQSDPHWRDLILFYEYFHGDNGAGLGASHQTGWTGLIARMIMALNVLDADEILENGHLAVASKRLAELVTAS